MQFLLINKIKVQNANAIAGFTWGFPAITHFLGFTHNLERKLSANRNFPEIKLGGCGVISHSQDTHTFGKYDQSFTQHRYQPYLHGSTKKSDSPPIIEEGKMNMTISLLIAIEGNIGNQKEAFCDFISKCCYTQKLAGGSVLNFESIQVTGDTKEIKKKVMPGFALMDRSHYLEAHFEKLKEEDEEAELIDAWLDFSALKQAARPLHGLISKHLDKQSVDLNQGWLKHLESKPYRKESIPEEIAEHFSGITVSKDTKKLLDQWNHYTKPTEKTPAEWEYLPKPFAGYLVPIMAGYKAISEVYENHEVANTRDSETPVCFVESTHSIGEWVSPHRISDLSDILWSYHHEEHWYLCKQKQSIEADPLSETDEPEDYLSLLG